MVRPLMKGWLTFAPPPEPVLLVVVVVFIRDQTLFPLPTSEKNCNYFSLLQPTEQTFCLSFPEQSIFPQAAEQTIFPLFAEQSFLNKKT